LVAKSLICKLFMPARRRRATGGSIEPLAGASSRHKIRRRKRRFPARQDCRKAIGPGVVWSKTAAVRRPVRNGAVSRLVREGWHPGTPS